MLKSRFFLIVAVGLSVLGCSLAATEAQRQADVAARAVSSADIRAATDTDARALLEDKTTISLSAAHGPQVNFTAKGGQSYLWYPGNNVILTGTWFIRRTTIRFNNTGEQRVLFAVCFQYGSNTINPVLGTGGGRPECTSPAHIKARTAESATGDIFGLATRSTPPFILSREDETFEKIRAKLPKS